MIELHNISKVYRMGNVELLILSEINLEIKKGEYLTITGPSGSGKSTLMNIIGCLDTPTSGKYIFSGIDISHLHHNELAQFRNKSVGFVFQSFNLLPRYNIFQNVELPLIYAGRTGIERKEMVRKVIELVGLEKRIEHKPTELSGGECQRVAIARAIVNNPSIILADEPTGNLDSKTGSEIIRLFKDLNRTLSVTVIVVSHDSHIAKDSPRTIKLLDGRIEGDERN